MYWDRNSLKGFRIWISRQEFGAWYIWIEWMESGDVMGGRGCLRAILSFVLEKKRRPSS